MDESYPIRQARDDDMDEVAEIIRRAWQPILAFHEQNMGSELFATLHSEWGKRIGDKVRRDREQYPDWFFVAEAREHGEVIAFIKFQMDRARGIGTVGLNAVAPEFQGRGSHRTWSASS